MRASCTAKPKEKKTAAAETGGSSARFRTRRAARRRKKTRPTHPRAESTYEFGWSVGFPKKKPSAWAMFDGTYDRENGSVNPGLLCSCHADSRRPKIRL